MVSIKNPTRELQSSDGLTLIEVLVAVALLVLLLAVVLPALFQAKKKAQFDFGLHYTIQTVPKSIIGRDGWINPDAMREQVYDALTQNVGPVDPRATGSLNHWVNKDAEGKSYTAFGGEFTTVLVPTSQKVLLKLSAKMKPQELASYKYRQIRARYWTEESKTADKPGGFFLAVEARTSGGPNLPSSRVLDTSVEKILLEDFVDALNIVGNGSTKATPL